MSPLPDFLQSKGEDKTNSLVFTPGQTLNLLTITAPRALMFKLTHIANYVGAAAVGGDVMAWGLFTWSLKVNGVPDKDYGTIVDQLGDTALPRELGRPIILKGGDVLTVDATLSSGSTSNYSAGFSIKGQYGRFLSEVSR